MISDRKLVLLHRVGERVPCYSLGPMPRVEAEIYVSEREGLTFELEKVPSCRCCGERARANLRCEKHLRRNPCVVEGCRRTVEAANGELADNQAICGHHWRCFVPSGSPERRAYHRFWRLAKKQGGWDHNLIKRFERFWDGLAARVRRRSADGYLDQRTIEAMFGWEAQAA